MNPQHLYTWRRHHLDATKVGRFRALLGEYMRDCAPKRYSAATLNQVRSNLGGFCAFLNARRIRSLQSVTPSIITSFIAELTGRGITSIAHVTGGLRRFFDWLSVTGRRKAPNPVIPAFHSPRKVHRLPRPFEARELEVIVQLLEAAGDVQLLLACYLGAEAGLRISEVCNLRVSDCDLERQEVFVRPPTKTGVERVAPFHAKTKAVLQSWLAQRGEQHHDHVLVAPEGGPLHSYNLRKRLKSVLCGPGKLERFSFHRLRASAATIVARGGADIGSVMTLFGWRNPAVAAGYVKYLPEDVRREYDRAMVRRPTGDESMPRTMSLDEFFDGIDSEPASPTQPK